MKELNGYMRNCTARIGEMIELTGKVTDLSKAVKADMAIVKRIARGRDVNDPVGCEIGDYIRDISRLYREFSTESLIGKSAVLDNAGSTIHALGFNATKALKAKGEGVATIYDIKLNTDLRLRKAVDYVAKNGFGDYDESIADIVSFDNFMSLLKEAGKYRRSVINAINKTLETGKLHRPIRFHQFLGTIPLIEATKKVAGWDVSKFESAVEGIKAELGHGFKSTVLNAADMDSSGKDLGSLVNRTTVKNGILDRVPEYCVDHSLCMFHLIHLLGRVAL